MQETSLENNTEDGNENSEKPNGELSPNHSTTPEPVNQTNNQSSEKEKEKGQDEDEKEKSEAATDSGNEKSKPNIKP